jgi:4-amino-4-deoxy-L-arabinose transferase-like glycosyltransferase
MASPGRRIEAAFGPGGVDVAPAAGPFDPVAIGFALLAFGVHAALAGRYDVFRDELYFIVCGRHPAFGYADQPPLVPLLAAAMYGIGHNAFWLRLPVAAAAGALAWLSARFARALGAGDLGAGLAALAVTIAPLLMGLGALLTTTAFDPLAWTVLAYGLVQAARTGKGRYFWIAGVAAGLDLEAKYALVFWGVSLGIGVILTAERRLLARRELWLGAGLAGLIAAPSLLWQAAHHFPFLELAAAAGDKNADLGPGAFVLTQILEMNPLLAPLWLAGLAGPFVSARLKPARFVAIGFVVCLALVMLTHGKDYYVAACYPAVFAIGAAALAPRVRGRRRGWARAGLLVGAAGALALSAAFAPLVLPILPIPALKAYLAVSPFRPAAAEKSFKGTLLPQEFADQLGWRDFAAQTAKAWRQIPPAERARTAIKVDNYGEAAALDIYGAAYGLPPALSGHNQYFLWGLRGQDPSNLLVVQNHFPRLAPYCRQATLLGLTVLPDAMASENGKAIAYCQGLKVDLKAYWPQLKHYD